MRRNLTISFDEHFIEWMDEKRGSSRGKWLEDIARGDGPRIGPTPKDERSPVSPEQFKTGQPFGPPVTIDCADCEGSGTTYWSDEAPSGEAIGDFTDCAKCEGVGKVVAPAPTMRISAQALSFGPDAAREREEMGKTPEESIEAAKSFWPPSEMAHVDLDAVRAEQAERRERRQTGAPEAGLLDTQPVRKSLAKPPLQRPIIQKRS